MKLVKFTICVKLGMLCSQPVQAHASEGGFILLLPTGAYITSGVAVVALTLLLMVVLPAGTVHGMFAPRSFKPRNSERLKTLTSLLSLAAMLAIIWLGLNGPRDPLSNLMPLTFWTLGWVLLVALCGFLGNLWTWINPWTGLYTLLARAPTVNLVHASSSYWNASLLLIAFAALLLAHPAPDDPAILAIYVMIYWSLIAVGFFCFGPDWLHRNELGHVIMGLYARLACIQTQVRPGRGFPGWHIIAQQPVPGLGVFALLLLGVGSFDGLNETFWWLGLIGVNPLEFPGRTALVAPTIIGLLLANFALLVLFACTIWIGIRLQAVHLSFAKAFGWLGLCVLPIALAYHIAHYLPSFLVSIQYTLAALSDPLARGDDWLGLAPFQVTTGFFNRIDTVRLIWLSQAGVVVTGHVWSILLSHGVALRLVGEARSATRLTLPLSLFMIAYTFLGLWLLAAPKGA